MKCSVSPFIFTLELLHCSLIQAIQNVVASKRELNGVGLNISSAVMVDSNTVVHKKFELSLTRRAKTYSSSCSQTVSLEPFRRDFYGGTALWCPRAPFLERRKSRLGPSKSTFNAENFIRSLSMSISKNIRRNSLLQCVSQPEIAKKSIKPPILAFKVIQGHWNGHQSRASVRLPISD